ncbi:hypothetical protein JCGZ_12472 [Jatropha curcas]|uniref:Cytochrome P450 n=1 Tax=Jatropha curcas TaxID=180498 RepID=A0A067K6Y8_JATCU|nr:hypothetical protein JCGZ_12472 [Jatropha curcas]
MMRMITGKRYCESKVLVNEIFRYTEVSYSGFFLPILQWVDAKGNLKKVKQLAKTSYELMQQLIDEQKNDKKGSNDSVIGHLLSLRQLELEYYTDEIIKALIMDIISAGTESSITTMEWTMSKLLNNQQMLEKAKKERACLGMGLANRATAFALGSMIQCFEWKRMEGEEIDMSEAIGFTVSKCKPLVAICKARDVIHKELSMLDLSKLWP